ncbi:MAG: AMP-dependent synthetase [Nitrospirae bacterium 13_2_20CM_2_62_8]|nr:MAG: AMP-dependent synthetase [Nitrospirae bacterium 13_2_20CM_2_62_8]
MSPLTNVSELWHPTPDYVQRSRLLRFMQRHRIADYPALYDRSIGEMEWFWKAALEEMGIEWASPYTRVLDLSKGIQWAQWFVGGRLNLVHNCVDKYRTGPRAAHLAIRWEGEDGTQRSLTYRQLHTEVCRAAAILGRLGVRRGDRVAVFLPMLPEVAIITLACSKLGATYTPIFSGFGAEAVAARVQDCEATLLVTADGFTRRGGLVKMKQVADEAAARCPTIKHLLVVRRTGCSVSWQAGRDVWWHDVMPGEGEGPATEVRTEVMAADEPFMIIYTSGTTGRPKGTVHLHSGFPIKAAQDLAFHFDLQSDDTLFWFTDMGWMMGPWEIMGALTLGATCLLYEGVPDWPHPGRLWEVVARHRVTILGLSPTAVRALMRHGDAPVHQHDLSSLRVLGSTGEPWTPDAYLWYFQHVGQGRCPIINYSGGTEVSGGIVGGTVLQPCKPCAFTGPCLGMAAEIFDADGKPVRGKVGELVVTKPWPGMTHGFWRDPQRYLETYWSRWPQVWVHGDWAATDGDGFWYILGRSDDTIKVAGKRLGPAEVEAILTGHPAVSEAAAIGVPHPVKGEALVCFVVLRHGWTPSEALSSELAGRVGEQLGKPLRPAAVHVVPELPKTRNAKILRRVIRAAFVGQDPGDLSSLENPQAVVAIKQLR